MTLWCDHFKEVPFWFLTLYIVHCLYMCSVMEKITYTKQELISLNRSDLTRNVTWRNQAFVKFLDLGTSRIIFPQFNKRRPRGCKAGRKRRALSGHQHKHSGLTLGVLNAQSVREKGDIIRQEITQNDLDVLCLTEMWTTSAEKDVFHLKLLTPPGYSLVHFPRPGNKGYGGVGLLHAKTMSVSKRASCLNTDMASFEAFDINFDIGSKAIHVVVVYRPPPSSRNKLTVSQFFTEFPQVLVDLVSQPGELLIVGDLNFHLDVPDDPDTRRFNDLLASFGLQQIVDFPTHRSNHTLDVVLIPIVSKMVEGVVQGEMISDHRLVICKISCCKPSPRQVELLTRKLRSVDQEAFRKDVSTVDIPSADVSLSDVCHTYDSSLRRVLDDHAPAKKRLVTIRPSHKWFSDELYNAKRVKRKAERTWQRTKLEVHKEIFLKSKCHYNQLLRNTKAKHFTAKLSEAGRDSKAVQRVFNEILLKDKEVKLPRHDDPKALADRFADFFSNKVEKIRASLPDVSIASQEQPIPCATLSVFAPPTDDEIQKIVAKSPSKSCSLDPMPTWLLKSSMSSIVPFIRTIISRSLAEGSVPDSLKQAFVSPLLKKPTLDCDILKNYRPVSNLSFISKVLERVVASRLNAYMTAHDLHDSYQSAYKAGHSMETAVLKVQNDLRTMVDQHGAAVLVLLDLSAAFDTVDHCILLDRLQNLLGITGLALEWFRSYLSQRKQQVVINGAKSDVKHLDCGVPQGSVLGPLLFLIYILPLGDTMKGCSISRHGYADDIQVYRVLACLMVDFQCVELEHRLNSIQDWLTVNKLKGNPDKTEFMLFGHQQTLKSLVLPALTIAGTVVQLSKVPVRNLGVLFDSKLSMDSHVSSVVRAASYHLRNIGLVRRQLTVEATKSLVQSLVLSRLDYCNSSLAEITEKSLRKLQIVQNRAARLITRTPRRSHITPVLAELHWLPVRERIQFKLLLLTFKSYHRLGPSYLNDIIQHYKSSRSLRSDSQNLLTCRKFRMNSFGGRAFSSLAPRLWNALPSTLRTASSVSIFRKDLKTYLFKRAHSASEHCNQ